MSGVSASTVTVAVSSNVTFTGSFPPALANRTTTVASTKTLTVAASLAHEQYINGTGSVAITDLTAAAVLSGVSASTVTVAVSSNVTFTGSFPPALANRTTTVASTKTLTVAASKAHEQYINGTGNLTVNNLSTSEYNGSNIHINGVYKIELSSTININTKFGVAGGSNPTLVPTNALTINATQINGLYLNSGISQGNAGQNVIVTNLDAAASGNYSNINTLSVTYNVTTNMTLNAILKNLSSTINLNIPDNIKVTVPVIGGHIAEVLKFTSTGGTKGNAYSNKFVNITGNGIIDLTLDVSNDVNEIQAGLYGIIDSTIFSQINSAGRYTGLTQNGSKTLKTDQSPEVYIRGVLFVQPA